MKLNKKLIAVPALAITAGLGLAACSSGSGNSGPSLTPGSATASQICKTMVNNDHLKNTLTGADTGTWIVSVSSSNSSDAVTPNSSGNAVASCDYTLDTGANFPATVTLFANGSTGLTGS